MDRDGTHPLYVYGFTSMVDQCPMDRDSINMATTQVDSIILAVSMSPHLGAGVEAFLCGRKDALLMLSEAEKVAASYEGAIGG